MRFDLASLALLLASHRRVHAQGNCVPALPPNHVGPGPAIANNNNALVLTAAALPGANQLVPECHALGGIFCKIYDGGPFLTNVQCDAAVGTDPVLNFQVPVRIPSNGGIKEIDNLKAPAGYKILFVMMKAETAVFDSIHRSQRLRLTTCSRRTAHPILSSWT
jgi:hypothetical protein